MVFLVIAWGFLTIAAAIAVYHLKNYHEASKKRSIGYSSTLSEREKVIIYDLEVRRERELALED